MALDLDIILDGIRRPLVSPLYTPADMAKFLQLAREAADQEAIVCSDRAGHSGDKGEGHVCGNAFGSVPVGLFSGSSEPTDRLSDVIVAKS